MTLSAGQVLDEKYRIVRIIGEGGMGAVYEGENVRIRRRVAIKVLHAGVATNSEMVQRFEREAQVAGTVGNDHILEILDLGALPTGERYMVMEYLDGETLTERIKSRGRLSAHEATSLVRQILQGLGAAHAAGIVHRDLKPDNIFILKEKAGIRDFVKIIDFGISKFTEQQGASSRMTRTGALMGTPHYMAPEQATGTSGIDARTDIYAIGIILYECITGRVPFEAETFNQLLFEIALAKLIPPRQFVPDVDPAIESIIMKASAREPGHRFQTTAEFAQALRDWEEGGTGVSLPPETSLEAIVAATVPRAMQGSVSPDKPITGSGAHRKSNTGSGVMPASVTAVSAGAPPAEPTINSWAQASQARAPNKAPPVLFATVLGVLLLAGGVFAAVTLLKPSPRAEPVAGGSTVPVSPPNPAPTAKVAPPVSVGVADVPVTPPTTAPPTTTPSAGSAEPVAPVVRAGTRTPPTTHVSTTLQETRTAKPEKPKKKNAINFGY